MASPGRENPAPNPDISSPHVSIVDKEENYHGQESMPERQSPRCGTHLQSLDSANTAGNQQQTESTLAETGTH